MAKSNHLKSLRKKAGLSQQQLAKEIHESQSNVNYWEASDKPPRSNVLIPLAKALGVSLEELLGESRPKKAFTPTGRLEDAIREIDRLSKSDQDKILDTIETLLAGLKKKG